MTRTPRCYLACAAALWLAVTLSGRAQAQTPSPGEPLPIRVGTLAPEGTPWHDALQEIGEAWKKASGGRITFTIYAGTRCGAAICRWAPSRQSASRRSRRK